MEINVQTQSKRPCSTGTSSALRKASVPIALRLSLPKWMPAGSLPEAGEADPVQPPSQAAHVRRKTGAGCGTICQSLGAPQSSCQLLVQLAGRRAAGGLNARTVKPKLYC